MVNKDNLVIEASIQDLKRFFHAGLPFCENAKEYSPHLISFLLSELRTLGVSAEEALQGTGLIAQNIEEHAERVSVVQMIRVAMNCLRFSPAVGLQVGRRLGVVACGLYGYAMMSCPDRLHLVDLIRKYAYLIDPFTEIIYKNDDGTIRWGINPYFSDNPENALYRFSIELKLSSSLRVCRDLYGDNFCFQRIRVRYPEPTDGGDYSQVLSCPIEFGQSHNEIIYASEYLVPEGIFNPDSITHKLMLDVCEQEAQRVRRESTLANEISRLVKKHIGVRLTIDEVAEYLHINARTLRRRLKQEGKNFSEIVMEQQMSLAVDYLRRNIFTVEEIAAKLGYSDGSSFRKAFSSWSGRKPSHFRKKKGR